MSLAEQGLLAIEVDHCNSAWSENPVHIFERQIWIIDKADGGHHKREIRLSVVHRQGLRRTLRARIPRALAICAIATEGSTPKVIPSSAANLPVPTPIALCAHCPP